MCYPARMALDRALAVARRAAQPALVQGARASLIRLGVVGLLFGLLKLSAWQLPGRGPSFGWLLGALAGLLFVQLAAGVYALVLRGFLGVELRDWYERASRVGLLALPLVFTPTAGSLAKAWLVAIGTHVFLVAVLWPFIRRIPALLAGLSPGERQVFLTLASLGLVIRLVLAPLMYHGDFATMVDSVAWSYDHPLGVYEASYDHRRAQGSSRMVGADYFPAAFAFFGTVHALYAPAFDEHDPLRADGMKITRYCFFVRLGYLWVDLAIAFVLMAFFADRRRGLTAFFAWWLNPIAIYVSYVFGQFDLLVGLALLLYAWASLRGRPLLSVGMLGAGGLMKLVPLFVLPVAAADEKRWRTRLLMLGLGALVFVLGIAPFFASDIFMQYVLIGSESSRTEATRLDLFDGHSIPLFPMTFAIVAYLVLARRRRLGGLVVAFTVGALFLTFVPPNPQWLMWILPLAVVLLVGSEQLLLLLPLTLGFFAYSMYMEHEFFQTDAASTYLTYLTPLWQRLHGMGRADDLRALGFGALVFANAVLAYGAWRRPPVLACVDAESPPSPRWPLVESVRQRGVLVVAARGAAVALVVAFVAALTLPSNRAGDLVRLSPPAALPTEAGVSFPLAPGRAGILRRIELYGVPKNLGKVDLTLHKSSGVVRPLTANLGRHGKVYVMTRVALEASDTLTMSFSAPRGPEPFGLGAADVILATDAAIPLLDRLRDRLEADPGFAVALLLAIALALTLAVGALDRRLLAWLSRAGPQGGEASAQSA